MDKPKYLKHPENGRVLPWTQILADRGDMIPCDADGNPLNEDCVMSGAEPFKTPDIIRSVVDSSGMGCSENREQISKMLNDEIKNDIDEYVRLKSLPYDGFVGMPPEWVPDLHQKRFDDTRNLLLNHYRHEQVLEFLDLWSRYIKEQLDVSRHMKEELNKKRSVEDLDIIKKVQLLGDSIFAQMHREIVQAIEYLVFLKKAVNAGEKEGVRMLGGQDAALGYKIRSSASKGGEAKGLNYSPENDRIHEAAKQIIKERTRKPGQRELSRLIVTKLYPYLAKDAAEKKAEAVRQQLRK